MWWSRRAATVLNTNDPLIAPYTARVFPTIQQMLNTTKQHVAILPGDGDGQGNFCGSGRPVAQAAIG